MLHIKYDGKIYEYAEGTTYEEIAKDFQSKYAARIALVIANGKIRELLKAPERDTEISFLTYEDDAGHKDGQNALPQRNSADVPPRAALRHGRKGQLLSRPQRQPCGDRGASDARCQT